MTTTPVVYCSRLRTPFRGLRYRDGILLRGPAGWAEFSPFWEYDDAESHAWWQAAHEAAFLGWPPPIRTEIPVNVTVPAVSPQLAQTIVLSSAGCRTAKVKVAQRDRHGTLEAVTAEADRLGAVREALGAGGKIRIDANGAWDVTEATRRLAILDQAAGGLEYVEQPCATVTELAALRRRIDIPIAADESIRRASDPFAVVRAEAADIIVLKVQPLGGVQACLRLAEAVGLPVVVSSALESSIGIAAGVALAAALPELPYACGLATVQLFATDVAVEPLLPIQGMLPVTRPTVVVHHGAAPWTPTADLAKRWQDRLTRVRNLQQPHRTVGE